MINGNLKRRKKIEGFENLYAEEAKRAYDDLKAAGINTLFPVVNYILGGNFSGVF